MRVPREWVWVVILVAVIAIALLGCAPAPAKEPSERTKQRDRSKELRAEDRENFTAWNLSTGLNAFTYEGHLYLWEMSGFILHAASCKGRHSTVTP